MAEIDHLYDNAPTNWPADILEQLQQQLAEGSAHLAEQRAQCRAMLHEIKLARASASDSSWELADIEQRLNDLKEQREGPGDLLMEREIAHLADRRAKLEERVLTQLLQVDDMIARVQAQEQALASAEKAWARHKARLIAERDRLIEGRTTEGK
jgi:hypothetical protein